MLALIAKKQKESVNGSPPAPKRRPNHFQDSEGEDEDEPHAHDTHIFSGAVAEDLISFYNKLITESLAKDLQIPDEDMQFEDAHTTQFGISVRPFGPLRTAIVEFLAELYSTQSKEVHQAFADVDLYNTLLFFFEYHPFNNFLH